jgi:hypothetical protein
MWSMTGPVGQLFRTERSAADGQRRRSSAKRCENAGRRVAEGQPVRRHEFTS